MRKKKQQYLLVFSFMNAVALLMWSHGLDTYGRDRRGDVDVLVMLGQNTF